MAGLLSLPLNIGTRWKVTCLVFGAIEGDLGLQTSPFRAPFVKAREQRLKQTNACAVKQAGYQPHHSICGTEQFAFLARSAPRVAGRHDRVLTTSCTWPRYHVQNESAGKGKRKTQNM
jgi:hypothetical protein